MQEPASETGLDGVQSRRMRALGRAKITLALIAPVIALAVLFLIARSSGDADAARVKDAPAVAPPEPMPTTPHVGFTNHWLS